MTTLQPYAALQDCTGLTECSEETIAEINAEALAGPVGAARRLGAGSLPVMRWFRV